MRSTHPLRLLGHALSKEADEAPVRCFTSRYGSNINWFPGHMASAASRMAGLARNCDVIVEIRDARLPFTSANALLQSNGGAAGVNDVSSSHRRVVVLNKADLANARLQRDVQHALSLQGCLSVFTTATKGLRVQELLSMIDSLPSRAKGYRVAGTTALVVGVPNVGKSSTINAIKKATQTVRAAGAATGAAPGTTRSLSSAFLVRERPHPLYLFDSPGIMPPRISQLEEGMKLCICGILPETQVPYPTQVEFFLWLLEGGSMGKSMSSSFTTTPSSLASFATPRLPRYAAATGLRRAYTSEQVEELLMDLAKSLNLYVPQGRGILDLDAAARSFIRLFQEGKMGRYTLDQVAKAPP
jgi:ribosome biogenesis GTPase A